MELIKVGKEAERILDTEAFKRAMGGVRDLYIGRLKATKPRDDVERRVWCEMLTALDALEANLRALTAAGAQADVQLEAYTPRPEETRFARMFQRKSG
jgi:hypothetical protein